MEKKFQYTSNKSWTTARTFSVKYKNVKSEFVLETLKQLVPPRGIEPQLPVPQTSVLSIIR